MGASEMTGATARTIAERIRGAFKRHRILIDGSPLAASLAPLDWLGTFDGEVFRPGGPFTTDRERTTEAVIAAVRLKRIAQCMDASSGFPGFKSVARHLRSLHAKLQDPQGARRPQAERQAWDLLFEVEVAGLLGATLPSIRMEEPDLVLLPGQGPGFGLACKRPQTEDAVRRAISEGGRQILRGHPAGAVLVNVDAILGTRDALGGYVFRETTTAVDIECRRRLDSLVARFAASTAQGLECSGGNEWPHWGALGVIFIANFVISANDAAGGRRYMNSKSVVAMVADLSHEGAGDLVASLKERLELGQAAFRQEGG